MSDHKALFDNDDIVRVTSKSSMAEHGGTLGNNKAFVMPHSDYRKMMIETGGDLRQIEKKLGFEPYSLKADDVVFAKIKRSSVGDVKMPSGNEGVGVSDKYWIPGGKTSGGVSEGVADLNKSLIKDVDFTILNP